MAKLTTIASGLTPKTQKSPTAGANVDFDPSTIGAKVTLADARWTHGTSKSYVKGASNGAGSPFVEMYLDATSNLIAQIDASGLTIDGDLWESAEVTEYAGKGGVTKYRRTLRITAEEESIEVKVSNVTDRDALANVDTVRITTK